MVYTKCALVSKTKWNSAMSKNCKVTQTPYATASLYSTLNILLIWFCQYQIVVVVIRNTATASPVSMDGGAGRGCGRVPTRNRTHSRDGWRCFTFQWATILIMFYFDYDDNIRKVVQTVFIQYLATALITLRYNEIGFWLDTIYFVVFIPLKSTTCVSVFLFIWTGTSQKSRKLTQSIVTVGTEEIQEKATKPNVSQLFLKLNKLIKRIQTDCVKN